MKKYSTCNWWPGNLRKHESRLCFSTRFCILNSIRIGRLRAFLGSHVEDEIPLSLDALKRVTSLLNEKRLIINSVFSPKIERLGLLRISSDRRPSSAVRYCDMCVAQGFHSYLHEIPWISSCPFHLTRLKLHFGNRDSKFGMSKLATRMATLCSLLEERCPIWPELPQACRQRQSDKLVKILEDWLALVSAKRKQLHAGQIWDWKDDGGSEIVSDHVVGHCSALVPMPDCIASIVETPSRRWRMQRWSFGKGAMDEFRRIQHQIDFSLVIYFYTKIKAYSAMPPAYFSLLREIQADLRFKHGTCRCRWGLVQCGWTSAWCQYSVDRAKELAIHCPYNHATKELEKKWGRHEDVLSVRGVDKERWRLIGLSEIFMEAGLVHYKNGMQGGNISIADVYENWPCIEWNDGNPLTEILEKINECQVAIAGGNLRSWLDEIESGDDPAAREDEPANLSILAAGEHLDLMQWTSHRR